VTELRSRNKLVPRKLCWRLLQAARASDASIRFENGSVYLNSSVLFSQLVATTANLSTKSKMRPLGKIASAVLSNEWRLP
jgi:hypothetical protein